MTRYGISEDLAQRPLPQSYTEALDVAYDEFGIDCVEPEDFARWAAPQPSTDPFRKRTVKSMKPLTLDKFCRGMPVDWCIGQSQSGHCIRAHGYWLALLRAKLRAVACGCDPLHCSACNTGGSPRGGCKHCQSLTGWERSPEGRAALEEFLEQLEARDAPNK